MSNTALSPGTEVRSSQRTYTIQRVLGQGGFGITYLVETDLKMGKLSFTGKFALKEHFIQMLCEREATTNRVRFVQSATKEVESSMRAFISEAQRLQRLGIDHRNIVNVDEVFEANGTAYYVMEYLDGGSLANYVKTHGGRLSWEETAELMRPICEAVAMLHDNRVAHYDIKPQNIMVMTDKQGLRPVLIDFGLAKHYDGQGEATSSIAAGGYTPGYAPIEQYTGLRQFSPASDVYALAATICFCLTGHSPAKADDLDLDALCDELLALGVSDTVANVLLRAMELRAAKRPANAGVLASALFNGAPLATIRKPQPKPEPIPVPAPEPQPTPVPAPEDASAPKSARPRRRWLVPAIVGIAVVVAAILFLTIRGGDNNLDESAVETTNSTNYRTNPQNLDLQVTLDGTKYYFSQSEWNNLSSSEQKRFNKQGVVIDYDGLQFIVKLTMERHGSGYGRSDETDFTWYEAMQWFSNNGDGWRLPTDSEGYAMYKQDKVCSAIKAFGGDSDPVSWYWTSSTEDPSYFCLHTNDYHPVNGDFLKEYHLNVRGVRAI